MMWNMLDQLGLKVQQFTCGQNCAAFESVNEVADGGVKVGECLGTDDWKYLFCYSLLKS